MINSDNTINSKSTNPKGIERASKPEGTEKQEKFKEIYGVNERKKTKEELAEEWDDVAEESAKSDTPLPLAHLKKVPKAPQMHSDKPISLFDLAKEKSQSPKEASAEGAKQTENIFSMAKNEKGELKEPLPENSKENLLVTKDKTPELPQNDLDKASSRPSPMPSKKENKDQNSSGQFKEGAEVNFLAAAGQTPVRTEVGVNTSPAPIERADMVRIQKIIDQIVDRVYQVEKSGETSTVIVINDKSSLFNGASIKISEFDTSKGQFNITIDNLSPEARGLVERNQTLLIESLDKKGYQVHQFVATTQIENTRIAAAPQSQPRERDPEKEEQRQQQKQPEPEEVEQ